MKKKYVLKDWVKETLFIIVATIIIIALIIFLTITGQRAFDTCVASGQSENVCKDVLK